MFVLAVIGALQVALFAGLTYAGMLDFSDEFDAFDAGRWARGDQLMKEWTDGLPTDSMKLYVNAWYPA